MVETGASHKPIKVVLLQEGRIMAFERKKLDKDQQNYSVYERELYFVIHALKSGGTICMVQDLRLCLIMRASNGSQLKLNWRVKRPSGLRFYKILTVNYGIVKGDTML